MNDLNTEMTQDERKVIIERLRELQSTKTGAPMPEWMAGPNGWGEPLSKLAGDAADLLEVYEAEVAGLERMREAAAEDAYDRNLLE